MIETVKGDKAKWHKPNPKTVWAGNKPTTLTALGWVYIYTMSCSQLLPPHVCKNKRRKKLCMHHCTQGERACDWVFYHWATCIYLGSKFNSPIQSKANLIHVHIHVCVCMYMYLATLFWHARSSSWLMQIQTILMSYSKPKAKTYCRVCSTYAHTQLFIYTQRTV